MKYPFVLPVLGLCLMMLVGCGGNTNKIGTGSNPPSGSPSVTVIADNWQLGAPSVVRQIGAALNLTNTTVTGSAHINDGGSCYPLNQGVYLSGTIDPQGKVSVTSSPLSGQVLAFTGSLDPARSSISLGNYTFTGGCANGDTGPLTGVKFKPVTGTYSGVLDNSALGNIAVSADLTQSPNLIGNGFLHVNGTVTYTSPTCSEVFTITDSDLAGGFIQLFLIAKDGTSTFVYGDVDSQASQILLADYDGSCGGGGVGTLIQQ